MRDGINEDVYLGQVSKLKALQYKSIRDVILPILSSGNGINELLHIDDMRINALVAQKETEIRAILIRQLDYIEKSQAIAKILVELL
jgi:hypothetical protein